MSVDDDLDDAIPHLLADVVTCQPNEIENGVHVPCIVLSKLLSKNSNLQHLVKKEEGGGGRRREGKEGEGGEGGGGRGRRGRKESRYVCKVQKRGLLRITLMKVYSRA